MGAWDEIGRGENMITPVRLSFDHRDQFITRKSSR